MSNAQKLKGIMNLISFRHVLGMALAMAAVALAAPPNLIDRLGFIKADGTRFVGQNGETILFRGVSLGNWLLPEAYMLQFGKLADRPRLMEKMTAAVVGEAESEAFWQKYRDLYITEADLRAIHAMGFNSIRPALNARLMLEEDREGIVWKEEGFRRLEKLLDDCRKIGLYVFVDLHGAPGGQTGAGIDDCISNEPILFADEKYRVKTVALWKEMARRLKDRPEVAAYDLLNEPIPSRHKQYYGELVPLYRRLVAAIREVDPRHNISLEGVNYGNDWSVFPEPFDRNVSYQFHKYWSDTSSDAVNDYVELSKKHNVPVWVGETGENFKEWYWSSIQMLEAKGFGWSFWPWKKIGGSILRVVPPKGWEKISEYTKTGKAPEKEEMRQILAAMLEAIRFENCPTNADVLQSVLRQIPGRIEGELYGHRGPGISYHLSNPKPRKANYNVGHVAAGEWLAYPVTIQKPGKVDVYFYMAGPEKNRRVSLVLDGRETLGTWTFPGSTGWQSWAKVTAKGLVLPAGNHELRFVAVDGDFNFDKIVVVESGANPDGMSSTNGAMAKGGRGVLPGVLEAEDYGPGGEGVGYHDLDPENVSKQYRNDGVDLEKCSAPMPGVYVHRMNDPIPVETVVGNWQVAWTQRGEWLKYTVESTTDKAVHLVVTMASTDGGGRFAIRLDGNPLVSGKAPATGSWEKRLETILSNVVIPKGRHVITFECTDGGYNLDCMKFRSADVAAEKGIRGAKGFCPGVIEMEDFMEGGEGVAYHDLDRENKGGTYREEGVDIQGVDAGTCIRLTAGDWTAYEVNALQEGKGKLLLRVGAADPNLGALLKVTMNGVSESVNLGGGLNLVRGMAVPIRAGDNGLKVECLRGAVLLDYLEVMP